MIPANSDTPRPLLPFGLARVRGPSMAPGLKDGDRVLVRYGASPRPGDRVLARRPDRPELVMVKRVRQRAGDGWWLLGDNPYGSDDSRVFGPAPDELVIARVLCRVWPVRLPRAAQPVVVAAVSRGRAAWARRRAR